MQILLEVGGRGAPTRFPLRQQSTATPRARTCKGFPVDELAHGGSFSPTAPLTGGQKSGFSRPPFSARKRGLSGPPKRRRKSPLTRKESVVSAFGPRFPEMCLRMACIAANCALSACRLRTKSSYVLSDTTIARDIMKAKASRAMLAVRRTTLSPSRMSGKLSFGNVSGASVASERPLRRLPAPS